MGLEVHCVGNELAVIAVIAVMGDVAAVQGSNPCLLTLEALVVLA